MKRLFIFCTIFISIVVSAQNYQSDPMTLEGQGSLMNVRIVMGEKQLKVFLTGKEAAVVDFAKDAKLLQITAFKSDTEKEELEFVPGQGYYTVKKMPDWQAPYEFKIKTQLKNKTENISITKK